jgi:PAS domain S-box-containing protein
MRTAFQQSETSDRRLRSALETLEEGFALYDEEDRLVVFNEPYVRLHPGASDLIQVGMPFEDLVRENVRQKIIPASIGQEEEHIQKRLAQHRNPSEPIVRELSDGTWYIINESKTPEGWTAVVETDITQMKNIEAELAEKSRLLEASFDAMDDGLSVWDADSRLLAFNKTFETLMGHEGDRPYPGLHVRDLFIMNARAGLYGEGDPVELGSRRFEGASRLSEGGKQYITFERHGTYEVMRKPMADGSRVTIHRNVTDRIAAEQRLALVVENLSELFVLWDAQNRLVATNKRFREVNAALEDILVPGLPYETYIRAAVGKGFFPNAEADAEAWIARRIRNHHNPGAVHEVERNNNQWLLIHEQRLPDGGIVSIGTDISEIKRVEAEIKEREQRLSAIVDNVVDGIITFDRHHSIMSANSAAARIFRCRPKELLNRQVGELLAKDDTDGPLDSWSANIGKEAFGKIEELKGTRFDGVVFPMEMAVTRVETGDENFFVCIVRDISARREMDRMKSEFVSTVSHELRTPLTSIRGSLGLVVAGAVGDLPSQAAELIQIAERNAHRLIGLVNDILDMEKIESGQMDYKLTERSVGEVVAQAVSDNQGYADEHQVTFRFFDEAEGATAIMDGERITQVMANLLSNAAKFSPAGGNVDICVMLQGSKVRVAVTDSGNGIPEAFREQVFEKFTQADSSDTRKVGGTGLGLSISRSIVQRHGGSIDFRNEVDAGATFFFDLPAHAITEGNKVGRSSSNLTGNKGNGRSILICEDDVDVARLISILLEKSGYSSQIAHSAEAAERLALAGHFDAMTVDLMLPDDDGLSLVRRFREHEDLASLPIVVVSAAAEETSESVRASCIEVIDWLSKPIDENRLLASVRTATERSMSGVIKILHVEDDVDLSAVLRKLLPPGIVLTCAVNIREAEAALQLDTFDLVILDIYLPDGSGLDLLQLLRSNGHAETPVLIFSGQDVGLEMAAQVAGALVKSRTSNDELQDVIASLLKRRSDLARK